MSEMSGASTVESLMRDFRGAMADTDVGAIVLDIDSPGGAVDAITEAAGEIRAARGRKPIYAVANTTMASAAYWLGSAADSVIAAPSAVIGSIGIIGMHVDMSAADQMAGERWTMITAGEGKANGNEHQPLTDEARDEMQTMADDFYGLFTADVAAARGVPVDRITDQWKAGVFTAKRAVEAGLADGIGTLDATVSRAMAQASARPTMVAGWDPATLPAAEAVPTALATLPIHEQLAVLTAEGERVTAHYAKRAELRAKEGRPALSADTEERLAALDALGTIQGAPDDTDLDTDQPEEADSPNAADWRGRAHLDVLEAATRGGYHLPPIEVTST
jgi:signal peptide peptidase SppA